MIIYPFIQSTNGFEFLQVTIPVVLALMLILIIVDTILEAKSENKLKKQNF